MARVKGRTAAEWQALAEGGDGMAVPGLCYYEGVSGVSLTIAKQRRGYSGAPTQARPSPSSALASATIMGTVASFEMGPSCIMPGNMT